MNDNKLELLDRLNIEPDGEVIDNYFVIDLFSYDEFSAVYNRLEKDIEVERDSDKSSLTEKEAHITYIFKDVLVELVALFDEDYYTLNIYEEEN